MNPDTIFHKNGKNRMTFVLGLVLLSLVLFPAHPLKAKQDESRTIALFPFVIYTDKPDAFIRRGLKSMFVSRLEGEGLTVLRDEEIGPLLRESDKKGVESKERAEALASELKVGYAIFGSVTTLGGGYSLDLAILDMTKDPPKMTRISEATDEDQLIPRLGDVAYQFRGIIEGRDFRAYKMAGAYGGRLPEGQGRMGLFFQPTGEGYGFQPKGRVSMRMGVMAFDAGDLNKDGIDELLILGRDKLLIYVREGETIALKSRLEPSLGEEYLKVSVGDIDGDGKAEIFLVSRSGKRAKSTVYAWDGKFNELGNHSGHLRAVRDQSTGQTILLFQNSLLGRFFAGEIYTMDFRGKGKLARGNPLPKFEKGVNMYSLSLFDLDKNGSSEFIGLGDRSYMHIWDREGKVLWSGSMNLGGTNNSILEGEIKERGGLPPRVFFNSSPVVMDIDQDGSKEILVIMNIPFVDHLEQLKLYKKSKVIAYKIEGTNLVRAWSTKEINYSLSDIQRAGQTLYLAALKGEFSKMTRGSSRIMWFE